MPDRRTLIARLHAEAKRQGKSWDLLRRGGRHDVYVIDGVRSSRRGVVEVTVHLVRAVPVGAVWHVEIPHIGRSTQAKRPRNIAEMAADLIESMTDEHVDPADIRIEYVLPADAQKHLDALTAARAAESAARSATAREQSALARAMAALGYSRRDTGDVLGVSHQRVQQLIDAGQ